MPTIIERLDVNDLPGDSRHSYDMTVVPLADGTTLRLPLHVAIGRLPGPCLAVAAGVHGDEPEGIAAITDFWQEAELSQLRGTLILIPVANPPAFAAGRRRSPLDGIDLNRAFPGHPMGSPSERIADRLYRLVADNAQFLFTLHSWYATGDALPHVEFPATASPVRAASLNAARASGFTHIRAANWHPGLFPAAVNAAGIPAIEAEIGGMGAARPENRGRYQAHITALMRYLGMLPGQVEPIASRPIYESTHVLARNGGMLRSRAELGAVVNEGAVLGTINDLHGVQREELRAPHDGVLMMRRMFLSVSPGDSAFTLFRPTKE
jgi:predicted deacylase